MTPRYDNPTPLTQEEAFNILIEGTWKSWPVVSRARFQCEQSHLFMTHADHLKDLQEIFGKPFTLRELAVLQTKIRADLMAQEAKMKPQIVEEAPSTDRKLSFDL